jgi:glycosyltransferase involved in cell wall biosynthesis
MSARFMAARRLAGPVDTVRAIRAAFLVDRLSTSGGLSVVRSYADGLEAHGVRADVVLGSGAAAGGALTLAQARERSYDVVVATWWETAEALFDLQARSRVVLLQGIDSFYYRDDAPFDQLAADLALHLPVHYLAVSEWLSDALGALRPGVAVRVVRTGIDKAVFAPPAQPRTRGDRLRVLVEGQPGLWFKGVREAVAAVRGMRERAELTLAALDPAEARAAGLDVDRVVGGVGPAAMAETYGETDVLVKLSRFEGLGMAPIEAFHCGVPAVVTPYGGHADYLAHGENGVVVGFDDIPGTTAWLDRLAADPELRARLSAGALATAARWPAAEEGVAEFARALRELADAAPPDPAAALASLTRVVRMRTEAGRQRLLGQQWDLEEGWGRWTKLSGQRSVRAALAAGRILGRG